MIPETTKKFSWKKGIVLFLIVGLLSAGLSIFIQSRNEAIHSAEADHEPQVAALAPTVPTVLGAGSSFHVPGLPVRLVIPAINVDANIQDVGIAWNAPGEMGIPTNFTDVGWYEDGPRPGMPGSAVIDGHLDGHDTPRAVFFELGDLKPGDLIKIIDKDGTVFTFSVTSVADYDYDASTTNIFSSNDSKAYLNLITCAGDWIKSKKLYNQRVVVFAELQDNSTSSIQ
jgi:LPXTG-site transpeptidase (sortase) family protein